MLALGCPPCVRYTDTRNIAVADAVGQFLVNELAHEEVYKRMSPERKAQLTATEQSMITLGCGITAVSLSSSGEFALLVATEREEYALTQHSAQGFAAAILSQPADTLLS